MTDHERIKTWLADLNWHCSDTLDYMRDARKRISELNEGYPKNNLLIECVPCDGRCGIAHRSKTLKMRRLNPKRYQSSTPLSQIANLKGKTGQIGISTLESSSVDNITSHRQLTLV